MKRNLLFYLLKFITVYLIFSHTLYAEDNSYVADKTCASCHRSEYQQWQTSHHALAMQIANNNSVLGNFNNIVFNYAGIKTTFFIKNGQYFINTLGPEWEI